MQLLVVAMKQPISVIGILIPDRYLKNNHQQGFTLIEIIVVVAIMAIVVTMMVLSTNFSHNEQALEKLGKNISKNIQLLYQEAIFENRNFAISLNPESLQVLFYNGEEWILSEDKFFKTLEFQQGIHSDLRVQNEAVKPVKPDKLEPHILILSSGEMTPFTWLIENENNQTEITLDGSLLGKVTMTGPISQI